MKKITILNREASEKNTIFFDFENDFPYLGTKWIEQTGGDPITEAEADGDYCEYIESIISTKHAAPCTKQDYQYIQERYGFLETI